MLDFFSLPEELPKKKIFVFSFEPLFPQNNSPKLFSSFEISFPELSKRGLGENIDLQIMQLPVAYQKAKEQVCKIWTTLQPLVVHVGLASSSTALIILEQCGKNKGYQERDACGFHPEGACCVLDGPEKIESTINMKTLWKNISVEGIDIILSRDAGR
uniref:Pyroglutamyl-peptidase I like n=1 Tax=Serinus canaria TaxID=9135 RepID=A0A8C9N0G3_SERCA